MERLNTGVLVPKVMSIIDLSIFKTHASGNNHVVILPYDLGRQLFKNDVAIRCLKARYRLKSWSLVPILKLHGGAVYIRLSRI